MADVWVMYPIGGAQGQAVTEERWRTIHRVSFPGGVAGPDASFEVEFNPADVSNVTLHGGYLWIDGLFVEFVGGAKTGVGTAPWDYTQKIALPPATAGNTHALLYAQIDLSPNPPTGTFLWSQSAGMPMAPQNIDHPDVRQIPLAVVEYAAGGAAGQVLHDRRLWSPARRDVIYVDSIQQAELDPHDRRTGQLYVDQDNGQIYLRREDGVLVTTAMHDPRTGGPALGGAVTGNLQFPGTQGQASASVAAHQGGAGGLSVTVTDSSGQQQDVLDIDDSQMMVSVPASFLAGLSVKDGSGIDTLAISPQGIVTLQPAIDANQPAVVTAMDAGTLQVEVQNANIGDTEWRDATNWCTGLDANSPGRLLARRTGQMVTLKFEALRTSITQQIPVAVSLSGIPMGFTASGSVTGVLTMDGDPTVTQQMRVNGSSIEALYRIGGPAAATQFDILPEWRTGEPMDGQITYITDDPWPTALPPAA